MRERARGGEKGGREGWRKVRRESVCVCVIYNILFSQAQELDRQAKGHMEETFRLALDEKDEKITVLQTQVLYMYIYLCIVVLQYQTKNAYTCIHVTRSP